MKSLSSNILFHLTKGFLCVRGVENCSWGDDRIVGAAKNLGYAMSDQTVGNILKRHGIPPAPERTKTLP